jgi:hypothetical protein
MNVFYAYAMLVLALIVLFLSFAGSYWNILTILLVSFIVWFIAALNRKQTESSKIAKKWIFWTAIFFIIINVIAGTCVVVLFKKYINIILSTLISLIALLLITLIAPC